MSAPSPSSAADRNLLFGILALQMDFISRDQLVAGMNAWVLEKSKPLGDILLHQGALRQDVVAALAIMVDKHLEVHGHDAQRSLQALSSFGGVRHDLERVGDADVQASVALLPDETKDYERGAPEPTTLGLPSSAGTRFRILRPHAKGGLGQVFVAHDVELHREVALKEIQEHSADNPVARSRFLLEAEITGGLEHPGIVPVYGLGQYPDGRPFYAMRFIRGDSLKQAIEEYHRSANSSLAHASGEASEPLALRFRQLLGRFVDVCNAMAYAHSRGVLHRDLKPGNIMLGKYGETLIVDWGLAKVAGAAEPTATKEGVLTPQSGRESGSKTQAGSALGTPAFMSPEQALGRLDLMGPASDIYSLGGTLYVLLTGVAPFADKETGDILQKVQRGEFARPARINPSIPAALDAICRKAMALRPEDRYATALDLAADVEHWLADEPVRAYREPWPVRATRWMRKQKPLVSGAAAALLVSVLAASAGLIWHYREQARQEAEAVVRQAEATRKRMQAEQSVGEALDQAEKTRDELHVQLQKPGGVFTLLNEPARWDAQVQAARAAVERAKAVLANAADVLTDRDADKRVLQLEALVRSDDEDRKTAAALEKIRLDRSTVSGEGFDNVGAAQAYPKFFAGAKVPIYDGARGFDHVIGASAIKDQWVAALDDWAGVALRVKQYDRVDQVLAMARHADPDPEWRDRIREIKVLRDPDAIAELAKNAPAAKLSPQMILLIVNFLPKSRPEREALLRGGLIRHPGDFWLNLQMASDVQTSNLVEAVGFARTAIAVRPHSAAAYNNLALMLSKQRRVTEAVAAFEKALEIEPNVAPIYANLAGILRDHKRLKEALAAAEKAIALNPKLGRAYNNLGSILGDLNRHDDALTAHLKAVEFDPTSAEAHNNLGVAYRACFQPTQAIAAYEKAIALNPDHATAYSNLALILHEKRRFTEAAERSRKAIEINPNLAQAHNHLGMALDDLNQVEEAITAFRKSIELKEDFAEPHYNLGLILQKQKRLDEAAAAFKKSVAIDPSHAHRHGALGKALLAQGAFVEALAATQKALDLTAGRSRLRPLLDNQRAACERALAQEARLIEVRDKQKPAGTKELLELAQFCQTYKQRHVSAVALYRQALEADPKVADDPGKRGRYNAACGGVLGGLGQGDEAAKLPDLERAKLRRQAHAWLRADLDAFGRLHKNAKVESLIEMADKLAYWERDPDLAGVRDVKERATLPADEQPDWANLWKDVAQLLKDNQSRFAGTKLSGALGTKETSKAHEFTMSAGRTYVIDLESKDFDTLLKVETASGMFIAENDDISGSNLNARLIFTPTAGAVYRLVAGSFEQRGIGAYTLRIREFLSK